MRTYVRDEPRPRSGEVPTAVLTKNMTIIEAAAADLGRVRLEDPLAVLVVMAEKRDRRFDRAAARLAARVIIEHRLSPADGQPGVSGDARSFLRRLSPSRPRSRCLRPPPGMAPTPPTVVSCPPPPNRPPGRWSRSPAVRVRSCRFARSRSPTCDEASPARSRRPPPVVAAHCTLRPPRSDCRPRR
jgi:hypothetical protein